MISVIIPYNNDRGFLGNCIKSIEEQTYSDFEIIPSKSDQNVSTNFNAGLKRANGKYVKFVCEDDWLPPNSLGDLMSGIEGADWVCANAYQVDPKTNWVYKPDSILPEDMIERNRIHGGTTLYRTELIREIGGMREELNTGEEYDMHLKLYSMGIYPRYVDKEVYYHRLWSGQKSRQLRTKRKTWRNDQIKAIQALYSDKV